MSDFSSILPLLGMITLFTNIWIYFKYFVQRLLFGVNELCVRDLQHVHILTKHVLSNMIIAIH